MRETTVATKMKDRTSSASKAELTAREQEALRLLRDVARAERQLPKSAPLRVNRANRYIAR